MHGYLDFYFELFWKNYFWKLKFKKKYRKKAQNIFGTISIKFTFLKFIPLFNSQLWQRSFNSQNSIGAKCRAKKSGKLYGMSIYNFK